MPAVPPWEHLQQSIRTGDKPRFAGMSELAMHGIAGILAHPSAYFLDRDA